MIEFKINSFSSLATMVEYGLLLKEAKKKFISGNVANYINLSNKEDIEKFLLNVSLWPTDCFEWITSIAKSLYYCDIKELNDTDIKNILSLIAGLGEIGNFITDESCDMTKENTHILNEREVLKD